MSGPALIALDIAGPAEPWVALGLMVSDDVAQIGDVTLRFGVEGRGIAGWVLRGVEGPPELDGLKTLWLPEPVTPSAPVEHELEVTAVDHVVVLSPDPRRTFAAFEAAGLELRRRRDHGTEERPLVQGFFRHGEAIIEVVGPRGEPEGDGPSRLWGLTLIVDDLDAAVERLGPEHCGPAKDAVQPGRRIASIRRALGLPVPVALMTA